MTFSFMNIHPRNEATWLPGIFLPQNFWLCSLFVHLDSRKTLQLFPSSIYWFLLCMEMALEDLHIYQSRFLTEIHIRMHVCTKSFSSAHFPTFTLHQTKA